MHLKRIAYDLFLMAPQFWIRIIFGDVWKLRAHIRIHRKDKHNIPESCAGKGWKIALYNAYFRTLGSYIGIDAEWEEKPVFPHGPVGVFISNSAKIGKRCVIFQQVTIGSNMIKGSKTYGAPTIEDGAYIGCGAKIIGNVHVGVNARIGANCVVVKDVPANSVTVIRGVESIIKEELMDNTFVSNTLKERGLV